MTGLDPSRVVSKNFSGHSIMCRYDLETAVEAVTGENQTKSICSFHQVAPRVIQYVHRSHGFLIILGRGIPVLSQTI